MGRLFQGLGTGLGTGGGDGDNKIGLFADDLGADLPGGGHVGLGIVDIVFDLNPFFLHVVLKPFKHGIEGRMLHKLTDGNVEGFGLDHGH